MMRALLLGLFLAIGLPSGLFFLATDARPALERPASLALADLEKGKAVLDGLGLRRIREGETRRLLVSGQDLDRGANYLAARLARGSASARIDRDRLELRASLPLPGLPRYLNLEMALAPAGETLAPAVLRIGALPLPAELSGRLLAWLVERSSLAGELSAARALLDGARLTDAGLDLRFTWRGDAVERAVAGASGAGIDERVLQAYRESLAQVRTGDFARLLGEVFALAERRGGDPVVENRAALTVLAEAAVGSRLLSRRGVADLDRRTGIRLAGREDFAQHFALSAFLAATGGSDVSDLVGLYKELKDSRGGSGFSFTDLAADRAGTRLGARATDSPARARALQRRLAGRADATAYFPDIRDLPEFMAEAEFRRRFGGVGAPAYQRTLATIDARIGALPILRD